MSSFSRSGRLLVLSVVLACATLVHGSSVFLSEFQPNPPGQDPATQLIELAGSPGTTLRGVLITIESDRDSGFLGQVDQWVAFLETFNGNGLAVIEVPDFENPSLTVVLLQSFSGMPTDLTGLDLDCNDDGVVEINSFPGYGILDAVGIADSPGDASALYGTDFHGTDLAFSGAEPELVFRAGSTGDWFAVNPGQSVKDAVGAEGSGLFESIPHPGFGEINPSPIPEPSVVSALGIMLLVLLGRRR